MLWYTLAFAFFWQTVVAGNHQLRTSWETIVHSSFILSTLPRLYRSLIPNRQNCVLRIRLECRERFPRHRLQTKPLVSDPDMHHVPWCMSRSLTIGGGENVHGIPSACATRNFAYLARGPWVTLLTHPGRIMFMPQRIKQWFVTLVAPIHYLYRCWP